MGRKRKIGIRRQPNGQPYRKPDEVSPEAVFVRQRELRRDGIDEKHAMDMLAGFTLGRLRLRRRDNQDHPGGISEDQFLAGQQWCRIVHQHAAIMGYKLNVGSPGFVLIGGQDCAPEPTDRQIARIKDEFTNCYNALIALCRIQDNGIRLRDVVYGVCVENWTLDRLDGSDFGRLRVGLNALAKVLL
jgi:hypothetical protein